jgi:UDP-N-acetylglucosamine transferase subunit ALG13
MVTLGTIAPYRFDSLIDAVLGSGLADDGTVWQLGSTARMGLPGQSFEQMPAQEFMESAASADIVITHAGVGTIMNLLDMGISPVVVPRRANRGEHVDDHQVQIARVLGNRAIGVVTEAAQLERSTLLRASELRIGIQQGRVRHPSISSR